MLAVLFVGRVRDGICRNFGAWPAEKNAAMTISGATLTVDAGD